MLEDAGDPLVPQTINSANTTAPLDRQTVERRGADVCGEPAVHLQAEAVHGPDRQLPVVRVRQPDAGVRDAPARVVRQCAVGRRPARPYGAATASARGTFDADFRLTPNGWTSAGIGYTRIEEDRTHRIFESTTDNVVRLTFDTMSRQWFSVRTKYEHAQRRGEGIAQGEALLASIGEQPELRHFDIANRDRDRVTIIGSVTPTGFLTTSLTFAAGKDDYLESIFGAARQHAPGLRRSAPTTWPNDRVSVGMSYSFEEYNALQRSRQANPGVQFDDPSRNWAADSTDRTHSVLLNADVARIANKVDLRLSYDFSRARARYDYITGPVADRTLPEEVPVPTTLPTPTELPPTLSEFHRGTVDLMYALTRRISVGVSYWYDRYRVERLHARRRRQSGTGPRTGAVDGVSVPSLHRQYGVGAVALSLVIPIDA